MSEYILQSSIPEVSRVERSVNIDSRDRNKQAYPNTNDYVINLKEPLFGVTRVELISAEIPKSEYFLDETNNLLEMLIDPVVFANHSPSGTEDRIIPFQPDSSYQLTLLVRIETAELRHGVISTISKDDRVSIGPTAIFNASPTSFLEFLPLQGSNEELAGVLVYSEDEDNSAASCRIVLGRYGTTVDNLQFSFGSEFGFEIDAFQVRHSVFHKRACLLTANKFGLVYNLKGEEVKLLVGAVGLDVSDTDGRQSNSNFVGEGNVYSTCRVNDTTSFVVYAAPEGVTASVVTIDSSFAIHTHHQLVLDSVSADHLSCDCMNSRILVAAVSQLTLSVYVLNVIEGPSLVLLQSTVYNSESSHVNINAGTPVAFQVDPNAQIRWGSDVFRVTTLLAQRVGQEMQITAEGGDSAFPLLSLEDLEYHRINLQAHPLDPDIPLSELQGLRIFTSETQPQEYEVKGKDTSSLLFHLDGSVTTLFYGLVGKTTRGIIRVVTDDVTTELPFTVFASGAHDVGNRPFTFRSVPVRDRALREQYERPGVLAGRSDSAVNVNGTGYVFTTTGELWSFFNNRWTLVNTGTNLGFPGGREGAMLAGNDKTAYLFGGTSSSTTQTPIQHRHFLAVPSGSQYLIKNIRNRGMKKLTFYNVGSHAFASMPDPTEDGTGWQGLVNVSAYFERVTQGFFVSSFADATVAVALSSPDSNPTLNPTGGKYRFELLVHPIFNSVDISGTLPLTHTDVRIRLEIVEGELVHKSQDYMATLSSWSNLSIEFDTSSWSSASLHGAIARVTCSPLVMHSGLCAVREPELFVSDLSVPGGATLTFYYDQDLVEHDSHTLPVVSGADDSAQLKNDLWSIDLDPYFASMAFVIALQPQDALPTDRTNRVALQPQDAQPDRQHTGQTLTATSSMPNAGSAMFSDRESLAFNGRNAIHPDGVGALIRQTKTGDFSIKATAFPVLCRMLLSVGITTTTVQIVGPQPSDGTRPGPSSSLPNVYNSGLSLVFTSSVNLNFSMTVPSQFMINSFIYIPETATGNIPVFKVGSLQLFANSENELFLSESLTLAFPRNEWFHLSWIANGMATALMVNGASSTGLVARDAIPSFIIGGPNWNGSMLMAGTAFCTAPNMDAMQQAATKHMHGHLQSNSYTIFSAGALRLSIDTSATDPVLIGSVMNTNLSLPLPEGIVDVSLGRQNGVVRLQCNTEEVSIASSVSLALVTGEVVIGAQSSLGSSVLNSFTGLLDEVSLLLNAYSSETPRQENDQRVRTAVWYPLMYANNPDDPALLERSSGSLTLDSDNNLWLFGGTGVGGSMNDLRRITTTEPRIAYLLNGSPMSTGLITASENPGSRSEFAHFNDGENIYVFGGETTPSVGPFQFSGEITKLYLITDPASSTLPDPFFEGSVTGNLYPVFTHHIPVTLESNTVIRAEVNDGTSSYTIFMFPEEQQEVEAFVRQQASSLPQPVLGDETSLISDFWQYSINEGVWSQKNSGTGLTPGLRSHCDMHYFSDGFYLLPGGSRQDLWSIDKTNWTWKLVRQFEDSSTVPPTENSLYWSGNNRPHLLTTEGLFINELEGSIPEVNLHYAIGIESVVRTDLTAGSQIEFLTRHTIDNTSTFPGVFDVRSASGMDDGCFFVTTSSKLIFAELKRGETASYSTSQQTREIVRSALPQGQVTLSRGVQYDFIGVVASDVSIPTTSIFGGVSLVADTEFTIADTQFQIEDFVVPSGTAHSLLTSPASLSNLLDTAYAHQQISLVRASPSVTTLRISYQNQANSRFGELVEVQFDRDSGTFARVSTPIVVSSENPSVSTSTNGLFSRTIIVSSTPSGTTSRLTDGTALSPQTVLSAVETQNLSVQVLNDLEATVERAVWLIYFVFNDKIRVAAQRSVANQLEAAPLQNLVGEVIRYTTPLTIASQLTPTDVRICRIESGVLSGEAVVAYSSDTELRFQDASVSHCDPLNAKIPPTTATETFSLLIDVGLVATDFSDYEITSFASIQSTNFLLFYLSHDRRRLFYRLHVREVGSYVPAGENLLHTFDEDVRFTRISPNQNDGRTLQFLGLGYIVLETRLQVDALNPINSTILVENTIHQSFDNTNHVTMATGLVTADALNIFSVHESSQTQACILTSRLLPNPNPNQDRQPQRRSFSIRMRPGDYGTEDVFVAELQNSLQTIDQNFICSFDAATTKVSIQNEFSAFKILLNATDMQDQAASNGLGYILGFREFSDVVSVFDGSKHVMNSDKRIDLFGRQYLYLFLATGDGPISSEVGSRNTENAFGRIAMQVAKGEVMFYTSSLYEVFANVDIPVITQFRIRLARFAELNIDENKSVSLYQPQGMEHSLSLKLTAARDKVGSSNATMRLSNLPPVVTRDDQRVVSEDDEYSDEDEYFG